MQPLRDAKTAQELVQQQRIMFLNVENPEKSSKGKVTLCCIALKTDTILKWKSLHGLKNTSESRCQWIQFIAASTSESYYRKKQPYIYRHTVTFSGSELI